MLSQADTPTSTFLPVFNETGVDVAFLVPTVTGLNKSIMDATDPVRRMLSRNHLHDFESQSQGEAHKVNIDSFIVEGNETIATKASLYRPQTKKGDPRIWFYGLKRHCHPGNLLALLGSQDGNIYVFNLSNPEISRSLLNRSGFAFDILNSLRPTGLSLREAELLGLLRGIANTGPVLAVNQGDSAVGNTLESLLGIRSNSSKAPDYKGIELKSFREKKNRSTLFTQVPDQGMTYREIVENFGRTQVARGQATPRFQLYETCSTSRVNSYGLVLSIDKDEQNLLLKDATSYKTISAWSFALLGARLQTKHPTTFWISADVSHDGEDEYFSYKKAIVTRRPNPDLLIPLLRESIITVDLAAHFKDDGSFRNHGVLFKMKKEDLPKLFQDPQSFDLMDASRFNIRLYY